MLTATRGILLHTVKYGENSIIATIYTEKFGRQSYIINAVHSKNSATKATLLQPLFILDMVVYQKKTREVQRMKEFKQAVVFHSLPFDIYKSTQALFIAELLYKLLREEESSPDLFRFIENSLQYFDLMAEGFANFHLFFLARLTRYLGIYPYIATQNEPGWLDLANGTALPDEPFHSKFMDVEQTRIFSKLTDLKIYDLPHLQISRRARSELLTKIVEFYRQHFDSMGEIKSMAVLKEVFEG